MSLYCLRSDLDMYGGFYAKDRGSVSFLETAIMQEWKPFAADYNLPEFIYLKGSRNRVGHDFDVSCAQNPLVIFSEDGVEALGDILKETGQLFPVNVSSERKFFAFYPTFICNCFDRERSEYDQYPNGIVIDKLVLRKEKICSRFLFVIPEDHSLIFVSEDFRSRVEKAGLKAFDWSWVVDI